MQLKIKKKFISFLLLPGIFCCNQHQAEKHPGIFSPKVLAVKGYLVPKDSIALPQEILVDENKLKKIPASDATIVPVNNNIKIAGVPIEVIAGKSKLITPGRDTFLIPKKVRFIEKPFLARMPETFVAKDMTYKNQNSSSFSIFGKQHGLKHGIVSSLLEDKLGNIWFGTAGGVTRYDGRSFTSYTQQEGLSSSDVRSMLQDKNGNIWFGTLGGGVSKFDGQFFSHFTDKNGLGNNSIFSMLQDRLGNLWFATWGGGVTKWDGQFFTIYTTKEGLSSNYVSSIVEDRHGNLWFGTAGGVSKFDGSFTNFTEKEGLGNNDVHCILEDKVGNLWFGTERGISKFDNRTFTNFTEKEGLINNRVFSILEDKSANIWFGTFNGLSKYDGHSFTNYTEKHGLGNNNIYAMLEDKSGNIWFGTAGGGVSKYNCQTFTHFTEEEGLCKNYVFSTMEDKAGNLWLGTWGGGCSKYDGKNFTHFTDKEGLNHNNVTSICEDKSGNIWFATYHGVAKYNGHSFIQFTQKEGLINNDVLSILKDKAGNLWFGTSGGVTKYDGRSFKNFTQREGLNSNDVSCIMEDRSGNLWFGTSGGVTKYDGHVFMHFTEKEGLSNPGIYSMAEDKAGNIWLGTRGGGVAKFDGKFISYFTEKEGLVNNFIGSILEDKSGNLWFGTRFGLSKLSGKNLSILSEKITAGSIAETDLYFKNYSFGDGFLGIGCNNNAILQAKDNTIWIGTNVGVTTFKPIEEKENIIPANIQITAINLFNEHIDWTKLNQKEDSSFLLGNGVRVSNFHLDGLSKWYNLPEHLSLAYNNNFISFNFIGITMSQPQNVKYQYQLEGMDKNLSALTTQPSASYGNLSPGNYTFKVKAMNSEGYWSNEYKYTFTIRPPWWKTWWFRIMAIVAVLAVVFFIGRFAYSIQLRKQRVILEKQLAIQYERQRISSDLHDDIGSTLSSINIYAGLAKTTKNNDSHLDSITQNISDAVNKLDDLVWSINPKYDSFTSMTNRLQSYAEPICHAKEINFQLQNNLSEVDVKLSAELKQNIYLTAKELVNNSIKHSGCKNIRVHFTLETNRLLLSVNDDGEGFDETAIRKDRNGLNNIAKRVSVMKGILRTETNNGNGNGTRTSITIPI